MKKILTVIYILAIFWLSLLAWYIYFFHKRNIDASKTIQLSQNTSINQSKNTNCIASSKANIYIYMYHYFRDLDQAWKAIAANSISPKQLDDQMYYLNQEIQNKNVISATMQDLSNYVNTKCFPNKNIVILTDDDWRKDSLVLKDEVRKYPNIYRTLWIIAWNISTNKAPFMNHDDIKLLLDTKNISLASHTLTHDDLSLETGHKLTHELCDSKTTLQNEFGVSINTIIYPDWKYNQDTISIAKTCWYTRWLSTKYWKKINNNFEDNFEINRIRVSTSSDDKSLFNFENKKI